ncbi:hypothetical protein [Vibrio alginolyticus]|uniref:hypothetical protein n=1 Tax=Vibrio alginolyticus TaxID=663 RepID=UPI00215D377D|nr:hypothetical protein [Vibrio alginolyticus]ELA9413385.1 hypothetical protein [Vibrio parahaemolyticus]MCR9532735.1 hypothetical protein [Vibrio alginolyticus]
MKWTTCFMVLLATSLTGCVNQAYEEEPIKKTTLKPDMIRGYSSISAKAALCSEHGFSRDKTIHIIETGKLLGAFDKQIALASYSELQTWTDDTKEYFCQEISGTLDDLAMKAKTYRLKYDDEYRASEHAQYFKLLHSCLLPFGTQVRKNDVRRYLKETYGVITQQSLDEPQTKNCSDYHALFPKVALWLESNTETAELPFISDKGLESILNTEYDKPLPALPIEPMSNSVISLPGSHVKTIR